MHVSSTDFGLSPELRDQLFANGHAAAVKFLAAWDQAPPLHPAASPASPTVIVAWSAGVIPRSRTAAQPTPIRPWRGGRS